MLFSVICMILFSVVYSDTQHGNSQLQRTLSIATLSTETLRYLLDAILILQRNLEVGEKGGGRMRRSGLLWYVLVYSVHLGTAFRRVSFLEHLSGFSEHANPSLAGTILLPPPYRSFSSCDGGIFSCVRDGLIGDSQERFSRLMFCLKLSHSRSYTKGTCAFTFVIVVGPNRACRGVSSVSSSCFVTRFRHDYWSLEKHARSTCTTPVPGLIDKSARKRHWHYRHVWSRIEHCRLPVVCRKECLAIAVTSIATGTAKPPATGALSTAKA
jgi:hypothetical protein